ncbi:methyltransferase domain-containing protein [Methanosalsum natronophilum]|uniref:Methyltransferase domain-containing protein n=1 Tax=Methanosalsum natronophilum TaxID=768733 RepID=A0A3R7VUM9_9EURY|nr:MAG: methyltransferase domain-containing protein [Methanosalsum natronophilum]
MTKIKYNGIEVTVPENVYEPSEDSFMLVDTVIYYVSEGMNVLEIGTGSGLIAATIQKEYEKCSVIATEINPNASLCAKHNGVNVIRTDMFDALKKNKKFDVIIFNPPYLPTVDEQIEGWLNYAFDGGPDGNDAIESFCERVIDYLDDKGTVFLVTSSLASIDRALKIMEINKLQPEIVNSTKHFFEELVVIKASKSRQ